MHCEALGVLLPDPESGELRRFVVDSPGHEQMAATPISEWAGAVFQTGQPLNATREEIAADPRAAVGHNSACVYPLVSREQVLGVLGVASSRKNAFTDDDFAFLGQIANQIALAIENALAYREVSELKDKLAQENVYLESEIRSELHFEEIVGKSEQLRRALKEVETVAPADSTVLIYGETGTGKELIARAVHSLSSRNSSAFVKLIARRFPRACLRASFLGTRRVHSPEQSRSGSGASNWRIAERSSSMKSVKFLLSFNRNSYAFCRSASSSAWAARVRFEQMPT